MKCYYIIIFLLTLTKSCSTSIKALHASGIIREMYGSDTATAKYRNVTNILTRGGIAYRKFVSDIFIIGGTFSSNSESSLLHVKF